MFDQALVPISGVCIEVIRQMRRPTSFKPFLNG